MYRPPHMPSSSINGIAVVFSSVMLLASIAGCPTDGQDPNDQNFDPDASTSLPIFHNSTDPTNDGAGYVGSAACSACHPGKYETTRIHGHTHALTMIEGGPPEYPPEATRAGVPEPPAGKSWFDISYVIAGYRYAAYFVGADGFVVTNGVDGVDSEYLLDFPPNGTHAGFTSFMPDATEPVPYDYQTCFRCHTTGPMPQNPDNPRSQDSRPGILGTWAEPGVQCEACHGPGSNHAPNPQARNIFVDSSPDTCANCHLVGGDPDVITVEGGFLSSNTQVSELRGSGGHSEFTCMICHNPHASITYDRGRGLRNDCDACHADQNLAFHDGYIFRLGDYTEELSCVSCHMPLAAKNSTSIPADEIGPFARVGDVRSHIFRIDPDRLTFDDMITEDDGEVIKDAQGRAGLTPAFVCMRCHNNASSPFSLSFEGAANIARGMHERAAGQ